MSKHILLVHDLAGYGKVSLSAMMPVLSHMGHHLYTLPTALVSNTLDYGKFYIQETTEYMRQSLKVWAELGFSFDVVSTGMILSAEQAALVSDFCEQSAKEGALVFVDPIMGDEGKLYNGIGEETVALMRELVAAADDAGRADGASRNSGRCARLIPKIPVSPVRGAADPSREFGRRFRA